MTESTSNELPESTRQVGAAFDAASADYLKLAEHVWDPIGHELVERTAPQPGERVLDACCGAGASALAAARAVGPYGAVDAVDVSMDLLALLQHRRPSQVAVHRHDIRDWPADGYDVVQCALGIFFLPDMSTATEQLISHARPGGRVGVVIWRHGAMELAATSLAAARGEVLGEQPITPQNELLERINRRAELGAWIAQRGLADVEVTECESYLPVNDELAWLVVTGSGFVGSLRGVPATHVELIRANYLQRIRDAGVDALDATTLIAIGRRPA